MLIAAEQRGLQCLTLPHLAVAALQGGVETQRIVGGQPRVVGNVDHKERHGGERGQIAETFEAQSVAAWLWACCHGMVSFELDGVAGDQVGWEHVYTTGTKVALRGLHPSVVPTAGY